jgi:hypothetical protein
MGNTENDIRILRKLLNNELFLGKFPVIEKVWVEEYGDNKIDIVLGPSDSKEFWSVNNDIYVYIHNLAKMAGVTTRYKIYP